jgi:hypothetical protein
MDEFLQSRSDLLYGFFGDGINRPVLPDNVTLKEYRKMLRSEERDQFVKVYQKGIDGE